MVDQSILDAFNIMWKHFPEPTLLIHKDRTILAVNALGQLAGIQPGIKCFTLNPEGAPGGQCRGCRANDALHSGQALCAESSINDKEIRAFWVPLSDSDSVYVHFTLGHAEILGLKQPT